MVLWRYVQGGKVKYVLAVDYKRVLSFHPSPEQDVVFMAHILPCLYCREVGTKGDKERELRGFLVCRRGLELIKKHFTQKYQKYGKAMSS